MLLLLLLNYCSTSEKQAGSNFYQQTSGLPYIEGKTEYLASPFVTAGDRVYMVGYQDGSFPDLGWHIDGERGGIWDHPIKLMDGFSAKITVQGSNDSYCLNKADKFINYPMANSHHFTWEKENLEIERFQFVPDAVEGAIIEFRIINQGKESKEIVFSFTRMTDLRPTWLGERTNMIDAADDISFDDKLSAVIGKDNNNPWYVAFGSSLTADHFSEEDINCQTATRKGLGKNATLSFSLKLKPDQEKVSKQTNGNGRIIHEVSTNGLDKEMIDVAVYTQQAFSSAAELAMALGENKLATDYQKLAEELKSREKTFSYIGAVMTIPTGVQAVAAANYGKPEDALRYITMLRRSFSYALPGSMYEVSPDFGMVVQAWNGYGVDVPIINHFFSIRPKAYEKSIYILPCMPLDWKDASIDNVRVGNNSFSLAISQKSDHKEYSIRQTLADWKVIVDVKNSKKVIIIFSLSISASVTMLL